MASVPTQEISLDRYPRQLSRGEERRVPSPSRWRGFGGKRPGRFFSGTGEERARRRRSWEYGEGILIRVYGLHLQRGGEREVAGSILHKSPSYNQSFAPKSVDWIANKIRDPLLDFRAPLDQAFPRPGSTIRRPEPEGAFLHNTPQYYYVASKKLDRGAGEMRRRIGFERSGLRLTRAVHPRRRRPLRPGRRARRRMNEWRGVVAAPA